MRTHLIQKYAYISGDSKLRPTGSASRNTIHGQYDGGAHWSQLPSISTTHRCDAKCAYEEGTVFAAAEHELLQCE